MKLSLFLCALALSVVACAQTPSDTICSTVNSGFARVEVPPLPDKLDLAGEPVPMQNQDTRESLMREMLTTLYMHSRTMQTHIEKSTEAACRYLIDAKRRLGSWTLAAAAFNAGVAGVSRRLEKQGVESYYDLFLPNETLRYVFRVLSFKLLMSDPAAYGYQIDKKEYYPLLPAYEEVTIDDPEIDWAAFAREHGTHYKQIRQLNPWIRDYDYTNKAGRSFTVKIPKGSARK